MTKQQVDPTTGRVIPTRESVSSDINARFALAIQEWIEQGRDPEHVYAIRNFETGRSLELKKDLTAYVMQQKNDDYYRGVNLGISIGRKEMVAAMEMVIPEKHHPERYQHSRSRHQAEGFNQAVDESHKRLKAMVGVLEKDGKQ
jgi:hypothetical protein